LNLKDPESMSDVLGHLLRYGVILSFTITIFGTALLVLQSGSSDVNGTLTYNPSVIPHGDYDVSLTGLISGLLTFNAFSYIELGALVLLATPVTRVFVSVLLFAAEKDRLYVYITSVVLAFLLFSIFIAPLISGFQA